MTDIVGETGAFQRDIPYDSTVRYIASPDLARVVSDVFDDTKNAEIIRDGLILSSRVMRFDNHRDAMQFKGDHLTPSLRQSASELQRIPVAANVDQRIITLKPRMTINDEGEPVTRGVERQIHRIYFKSESIALAGLYHRYLNGYPGLTRRKSDKEEYDMDNSLSLTVSADHLTVPGEEVADRLTQKLRARGGLFYAVYARSLDIPIAR